MSAEHTFKTGQSYIDVFGAVVTIASRTNNTATDTSGKTYKINTRNKNGQGETVESMWKGSKMFFADSQ